MSEGNADPSRCCVAGCERSRYARQPECEAHYRRRRRTGDVNADRGIGERADPKVCMVETCDNTATERGLCHGHYLRLIRLGSVQADRPLSRQVNSTCTVQGCLNKATARGLCSTHRTRVRKAGSVRADVPVRSVAGLGYKHHGYSVVPVPPELRHLVQGKTAELEHRFVMAQLIGRPLTEEESVHHRNGDRLDNRPSNLELWSRWQPRGQRVCDKVEFAAELLKLYAPELLAHRPTST